MAVDCEKIGIMETIDGTCSTPPDIYKASKATQKLGGLENISSLLFPLAQTPDTKTASGISGTLKSLSPHIGAFSRLWTPFQSSGQLA